MLLGTLMSIGVPRARASALEQVDYLVFSPLAEHPVSSRQPTQGPAPLVSVNLTDSTVEYAVREVARQAHLRVGYHSGQATLTRRVSVHLTKVTAMDAFAAILKGTGMVAKMTPDGEMVLIGPRGDVAERGARSGGSVTGVVLDSATRVGLKGAQVRVEGMPKLSAMTADSGNFTLRDIPAGDQVLTVRLFGYKPATRTITVVEGERTTVRIAMAPVPTVLSGVVTTATGVQRKVEVGNDITSINVDSVMRVAPISTVTDLLETRVPGLTVQHTSGVPGNPSRIRIRGVSSITGNNDPIVIVDGVRVYASQSDPRNANLATSRYQYTPTDGSVRAANTVAGSSVTTPAGYAAPSPLDQIDPNSIETIEVFKGPSASALYGSDAANGVIVITTKRGRAGPTHWNLNFGQGVNWLPGNWPTHYFKFGSADVQNEELQVYCLWYDPYCHIDSLVAYQALNDPRFSPFTHGSNQRADLTVSGGVPTLQYSLTGSTAGNVGNLKLPAWEQRRYEQFYGPVPHWIARPDNYTTYGVSGQLTAQPTATTWVTLQSSLFHSDQQQGSLQQALTQLDGEYLSVIGDSKFVPYNGPVGVSATIGTAQLIQDEVERATSRMVTANNALRLAWQPWSWLPLSATGGLNTVQRVNETYIPFGIGVDGVPYCSYNNLHQLICGTSDTTGSYGLGRGTSEDKTLGLNTTLPSRWLTTALGVNYHSSSTNDFNAYTNQLAPGVSTPTVFLYPTTSTGFVNGPTLSTLASSTYGWFVEPRLNFQSRFFVAPGFRLDGGSASGTHGGFSGTGLTGFPKLDFSWLAIDRDQPRGPVSLLRPRVAFGYAGTQPAPDAKLRLLNRGGGTTVALNDTTLLPTVVISTLGNTALRPETSREFEGGFDAELWRGRLTVTWTQYNKTRNNAIISVPVAPSAYAYYVPDSAGLGGTVGGVSPLSQYVNVGQIRNTGTELTVNASVLESHALGWTIGANLSNDHNRVVRLAPGFTPNKVLGIVPGYPLFSQWAAPLASYYDLDSNHIITPNEYTVKDSLVYVGQAEPKYQLNLNTDLMLLNGRLSVHATFAYQDGLTQNNLTGLQSRGASLLPNTPGISVGTLAAFSAAYCAIADRGFGSPFHDCINTPIGMYQTVNTFRFNELSVNYNLPTTLTQWLHVPRASLAVQGSNLGLHTNYRGLDPNVNAFSTTSGGGDQTADLGQIPEPRVWWLKLNLGN